MHFFQQQFNLCYKSVENTFYTFNPSATYMIVVRHLGRITYQRFKSCLCNQTKTRKALSLTGLFLFMQILRQLSVRVAFSKSATLSINLT